MLKTRQFASAVALALFSSAGAALADDCILQVGSFASPAIVNQYYECHGGDGRHWVNFVVYFSGGNYYVYGEAGDDVVEAPEDGLNENNNQLERFHLYGLYVNSSGVEVEQCGVIWTQGASHSSGICPTQPNRLRIYANPQEP